MGDLLAVEPSTAKGMTAFLKTLPADEIHGLLKTTTGGLIAAGTVEEAISVILRYSDGITLLNRRRVKKDYLIKYLLANNVGFPLSADKTKLCRIVLSYWGEQNCRDLNFIDLSKGKAKDSHQDKPSAAQPLMDTKKNEPYVIRQGSSAAPGIAKYFKKVLSPVLTPVADKEPKSALVPVVQQQTSSSIVLSENAVAVAPSQAIPQKIMTTSATMTNITQFQSQQSQTAVSHQLILIKDSELYAEEEESMDIEECINQKRIQFQMGQSLGEQFTSWFYQILNSQNDFGPHHFWPECNLRVEYIRNNTIESRNVQETLHNGQKCFEQMKELSSLRQLFFNPNLIPGIGVRGKINPHGLAQVMTCGTLLQRGSIIGVFEQVFGLMMDPGSGNNYKIKFSLLRLREGNHMINGTDPLSLCDTSLAGIVEEVDLEDDEDEFHLQHDDEEVD